MAFNIDSIPDQTGKVAVITGANGGLGLASATALAGAGAHVVMAARNQTKAVAAREQILAQHPDASLEVVELDLGSLASVEQAARTIGANHPRIDILMNNAGLMALPERKTVDGFEMQFGVNHLGHWALTSHLLPKIIAADAGRVVSLTSVARHQSTGINADNPNLEGSYDPWKAYAQSKYANFVFAKGLQEQFDSAGVNAQALAAHPGLTNSDLQSHTQDQGAAGFVGWISHAMATTTGMSTESGSLPQLRAATDPNAKGGELYGPRFGTNGRPVRLAQLRPGLDKNIEKLWTISEEMTGLTLDVSAAATLSV